MSSDDRLDETIAAMARQHNRAPATPRDEMWAAIAAARDAARREGVAPVVLAPPTVIAMRRPRTVRRWAGAATALAATLVIGFVLGRRTGNGGVEPSPRVAMTAPVPGRAVTQPPTAVAAAPVRGDTTARGSADNGDPDGPPKGPQRPVERGATALARHGTTARSERVARSREEATLPYRVAAMQHLATTEALLVSLRSDVRAGRRDTTIAGWAGDLLGTTRMLMDSPASKDPQLRQLLQDLELVLAQIARLPGASGEAADLGLIDDAVQRREIMTRLRAITPGT